MRTQANRDYISNDCIQTPYYLAEAIVNYFRPTGRLLEPCIGNGSFYKVLSRRPMSICDWCEISKGRDFFNYNIKVDWIMTNPPWSKVRKFLQHSMSIADNIVFLITINHLWTKARLRDMKQYNFGIKEILMIPEKTKDFPQTGFRCAACYLKKNYKGDIKLSELILE